MNNDLLYDENGIYIGSESEYNEFGIDTSTGEPFYGKPPRTIAEAYDYYAINTAKKEAKAEGKAEAIIEIARRMKTKGFSETDIADITCLSCEGIKEL